VSRALTPIGCWVRSLLPVRRVLVCCTLGALVSDWTGDAHADPTVVAAAIARQPISEALDEFARRTGLQLVYVSDIARSRMSPGAPAGLGPAETLARLLDGTGLTFEFLNDRTVRIVASGAAAPAAQSGPATAGRKLDRAVDAQPGKLEDVVVTGSRGDERLSQVPISIAAWTADAMESSGVKEFAALAALTPGVEFDTDTAVGPGILTNIAVRGVNDAGGRSTVRMFIDDAPVHSLQNDFGEVRPLLFDVDRVEILRGPQGALLGEGTESGAIRFVLRQPSLTTFSGETRAAIESTERGGASYEVGAAAGGPLVDEYLGFRASAWYRRNGGYVDHVDPLSGALIDARSNWSLSKAARLAVTYAPAKSVRITPSFSYQTVGVNDSPIFFVSLSDPGAGVLRNGKLLRQPSDDGFALASINASVALPFAELTSVTAYFRRAAGALVDYTNSYPNFFLSQFGAVPVYPVAYDNAAGFTHRLTVNELTEELRVRSPGAEARLTWVAGFFYSNIRQRDLQTLVDSAVFFGESDVQFNPGATIDARMTESQIAAFGELDYRFWTHLGVDLGARVTRDETQQSKYDTGLKAYLAPSLPRPQSGTQATPRAVVSYQQNEHSMYYISASEGYRRAGVDPPLPFPCAADLAAATPFPADTIWSYEAGAKGTLLGGRMHIDLSAYRMQWRSLHQLLLSRTSCFTIENAEAAAGKGFDLGVQAAVTDHLRADLAVAYAKAYFTQTTYFPSAYGGQYFLVHEGDSIGTLPQVPSPWNVTAAVNYAVTLARGVTADFRVQDVLHSRNPGPFSTRPASQSCCLQGQAPPYPPSPWPWSVENDPRADPATNVVSARARFSRSSVDVTVYIDNALNSQPTLTRKSEGSYNGFVFGPNLVYATTLRPRTLGLSVATRF
jgi:iron complex outermembrane receptor protein